MRSVVLSAIGGLILAVGCSSGESAAKADKICTPNAYVFCRCQDRMEGTKLCNETGTSFGKCEPCESDSNPEIPDDGSSGSSSGYVPIDEDGGSSGEPPTKCGDGKVEPGEDCDDKNANDADGCNTTCKLAGTNPPQTNACPGLEVHVWGDAHKPTITGSTKQSGNRSVSPTCTGQVGNPTSGAAAPDRVFKVIAHKTGSLRVATSDANYDVFLYASATCGTTEITPIACKNGTNGVPTDPKNHESLAFPVDSGKTYYVFVDGAGLPPGNEGNFRVTFSIE